MPAFVNDELIDKIRELGDQAAGTTGIEIADVQLRGAGKARLLRVFIDKAGGVTHADCELVSERLGQLLDEQETMPEESYTLEVSSLGSERKFASPRDYERVLGQRLAVAFRAEQDGSRHAEGKLLRVDGRSFELEVRPGETLAIAFDQVARTKLKFEP